MRCHLAVLLVVLATAAQVLAAPQMSFSSILSNFIRDSMGAIQSGVETNGRIASSLITNLAEAGRQFHNNNVAVTGQLLQATLGNLNTTLNALRNATDGRLPLAGTVLSVGQSALSTGSSIGQSVIGALNSLGEVKYNMIANLSGAVQSGTAMVTGAMQTVVNAVASNGTTSTTTTVPAAAATASAAATAPAAPAAGTSPAAATAPPAPAAATAPAAPAAATVPSAAISSAAAD